VRLGFLRRLRDRARRLLRRTGERLLGRTYDGAAPPPRLVDEVRAFSELHPYATREEWEDFSLGMATGAWRDGFSLGVEWRERVGEPSPFDEAALSAEERRALNWTAPDVRRENDPLAGVPPERVEEVLREVEFASNYGGFAWRWVDGGGRPIFPPVRMPEVEDEHEAEGDEGRAKGRSPPGLLGEDPGGGGEVVRGEPPPRGRA
jgi:hypothetical protein